MVNFYSYVRLPEGKYQDQLNGVVVRRNMPLHHGDEPAPERSA